jgi:ferrous iron transport protein A
METLSLRKMKKGQLGTVSGVTASGELERPIREIGLIPGARITVTGLAPLQAHVAIRVMDCTLTLRNNEADCIFVDSASKE